MVIPLLFACYIYVHSKLRELSTCLGSLTFWFSQRKFRNVNSYESHGDKDLEQLLGEVSQFQPWKAVESSGVALDRCVTWALHGLFSARLTLWRGSQGVSGLIEGLICAAVAPECSHFSACQCTASRLERRITWHQCMTQSIRHVYYVGPGLRILGPLGRFLFMCSNEPLQQHKPLLRTHEEVIDFPHTHNRCVDWWALGVLTFEIHSCKRELLRTHATHRLLQSLEM